MRNWIAVRDEEALLDEVAQRRQRLSALRISVTPLMGQLAAAYGDAYPWMDPSLAQSFIQAGLSPDEPQVQSVADLAASQATEDGDFDDPADDVPDSWLATLGDAVLGWAKPVVRAGFTILATPFEEVQALLSSAGTAILDETEATGLTDPLGFLGDIISDVSDVGALVTDFWTNYTEKAARSGGLLALGDLLQGESVDLGEGFLPGGEIFAERELAKQRLRIDGQFVTPGRLIARQFTEPGSGAYQFLSGLNDFAQNIFLDPVAVASIGLSKGAKATRAFQATGIINGIRKTVAPERAVNHYLTSNLGQRTIRWLTNNTDVEAAWRATGRVDLRVAERLAGTTNDAETFQILSETLGTVIRQRPNPGFISRGIGGITSDYGAMFGGGAQARRSIDNSRIAVLGRLGRLGDDMPSRAINIHDPNDAARQLDLWMRNAGMPRGVRSQRITEMASVEAGDQVGMFEAVRKVMDDTEGLLVTEWGVRESTARQVTSLYENLSDDLVAYDLDDLGRHVDTLAPLRINVSGEVIDVRPTPGLISELVNDIIPLPDARAVRRLTPVVSQLQRLYDSGLWKGSIDGLDTVMSVWKPLQLLRGAYLVRVVGEEQVRMAGAGYDSLFRHPMSGIAWSLSVDPKSRLGRKVAEGAKKLIDPKGTQTVTGELFDEIAEHASAMSRGSAGWRGLPGEVLTGRFVKARFGDEGFHRGWAVEFAHQANDPVMRRVAGGLGKGDLRSIGRKSTGSTFDDVAEWFWSGTGQKWRKDLGRMEGRSALLSDRTAADAYLRQNFFDRLRRMTGGDPDLVELVGKGHINDINLRGFGHETKLSNLLEDSYQASAPRFVKTPEVVKVSGPGSRTAARLDRAVERGFEGLMSRPTNWLSRSPTFRQKYWQRVEELIGSATGEVQREAVKAARAANVGGSAEARMATRILQGEGSTLTSLDDVDILAKAFALSETKKLLYDLSKRNQFFDVMRLVFPFGEAWKEIVTAWTTILRQNPQVIRRFQQGLEGVRAPSLLGEVETEPGTGEGFFHPDPQTGEEVFCVDEATEALTQRGWVHHFDLTEDDRVLSLDPDTDTIRWEPVQSVHRFDWNGDLIRWSGMVDALTTPNHRWLVEDWRLHKAKPGDRKRNDTRWRESPQREFKTTKWLSAQYQRPIVTGGGDPHMAFASNGTFADELVEVIGWVVTEGNYAKDSLGVTVTQSEMVNPEHVERLRILIKYFSDQGATATEQSPRRGGECTFYFGKGIHTIIRAIAPDKQMTAEFLRLLTHAQAELLLDTLIAGDGHTRPNGHRQWLQKDQGRVDGFQMLCSMLGQKTRDRTYGDKHSIWLNSPRHTYTTNACTEHYEGTVWCPRLATGVWLARRTGATYWTGNTYPGGGWISKMLLGTDKAGVGFVGRAAGLNLASATVLPGFGPVIQIPASKLLPETPKWDDVRDILLPFGESEGIFDSFTPAWFDKVREVFSEPDPDKHRLFANTVADVMRALQRSGDYDIGTVEGQQELLDDATAKAKILYAIRGAAQFVVPTGPSFTWSTADVEGNIVPVKILSDELRRMTKEEYGGDRQAAFTEWVRRFGVDNVLAVIGKSTALVSRPVTEKGDAWLRAHADLERTYPTTIGLFAPEPEAGEFDYNAYLRQFETGGRETLSPAEQLAIANDFMGRIQWEQAKKIAEFRPSPTTSVWLADIRTQIAVQFPGFDGWVSRRVVEQRPNVDQMIAEIRQAITEPELAATDAGKGTILYLSALTMAESMVPRLEGTTATRYQQAKAAAPIRAWLRSVARQIKTDHPDFARVWRRVFERELADDEGVST